MHTTEKESMNSSFSNFDQVNEIKVFLNKRNEGTFICPTCNNCVIKNLKDLLSSKSVIKLSCKCKCGITYKALVERRIFVRKPVNFTGIYIYHNKDRALKKGPIRIINLSRSGMLFSVDNVPEFTIEDRIVFEFRLKDEAESQIREEGIVTRIESNKVGIKFISEERYGKLGLYLL